MVVDRHPPKNKYRASATLVLDMCRRMTLHSTQVVQMCSRPGTPLPAVSGLLHDHTPRSQDESFVLGRHRVWMWQPPGEGPQQMLFAWVKYWEMGLPDGTYLYYFAFMGGSADDPEIDGKPLRYLRPHRRWFMPRRFQARTGREPDYPVPVPPRAERWLRRMAGLPVRLGAGAQASPRRAQ